LIRHRSACPILEEQNMETPDLVAQVVFHTLHFRLALKKCHQRPLNEVCLAIRFDDFVAGWARGPVTDAFSHDAVEHISSEGAGCINEGRACAATCVQGLALFLEKPEGALHSPCF
jgi:hypothetical protein